ncbi:nitroreductase [Cyathus striatus]|nr:nitroreductase [Cyathus striatus]
MDADSLMKSRFSCRFYLPRQVDKETVNEIIDVARYAPSGNNLQPWHKVYCISGDFKDTLSKELQQANLENPDGHGDYKYYPDPADIPPLYAARRREFGKVFYPPLGVQQHDMEARRRVSARNYEFFGAPVAFIFTIHKDLTKGSWLDLGFFLQSMAISARARGLETITMESVARYQQILRKHLPIGEDETVVCGMCVGYPDLERVSKLFARQPKRDVSDIISTLVCDRICHRS